MNNKRRGLLKRATEYLGIARNIIDTAHDEEEDAMNNMPESLQDSERYEIMEETVDTLDEVLELVDGAIDSINSLA